MKNYKTLFLHGLSTQLKKKNCLCKASLGPVPWDGRPTSSYHGRQEGIDWWTGTQDSPWRWTPHVFTLWETGGYWLADSSSAGNLSSWNFPPLSQSLWGGGGVTSDLKHAIHLKTRRTPASHKRGQMGSAGVRLPTFSATWIFRPLFLIASRDTKGVSMPCFQSDA